MMPINHKFFDMNRKLILTILVFSTAHFLHAQKKSGTSPDSIPPVGIIRNLSDSALLETVQRQTFRYFWHFAHPVSGLSRERDNTIRGEYFWDYANEAYNEPNLSVGTLWTRGLRHWRHGFRHYGNRCRSRKRLDRAGYSYPQTKKNG